MDNICCCHWQCLDKSFHFCSSFSGAYSSGDTRQGWRSSICIWWCLCRHLLKINDVKNVKMFILHTDHSSARTPPLLTRSCSGSCQHQCLSRRQADRWLLIITKSQFFSALWSFIKYFSSIYFNLKSSWWMLVAWNCQSYSSINFNVQACLLS